ncbi:MAG: hypothetical protein U5O15_07265 [Candidatus Krumholzibacteriota bacterium]|nr:hypothetical protein [Candidatus Krumholzibacteriota bacterium]
MKSRKELLRVMILLLFAGSAGVRAAGSDSTMTAASSSKGDTLKTEKSADQENPRLFTPKWNVTSRAGMSKISLGSGMKVIINPGGGWIINSSINVKKEKNRTRNMVDLSESFKNSAVKIKPDHYMISLSAGEDYRKSKTVSLSRFGKDIIFENERAGVKFDYNKPIFKNAKSLISLEGDYVQGQQDFKYDRKMTGSAHGHMSYRIGDDLTLSGGYGTLISRESSEIGSIEFNDIPSRSDTLKINAGYEVSKEQYLRVEYERKSGDIKRVEPPRGNSLEILDNPELAKREQIDEKGEILSVNSGFKPASFVTVEIEFKHSLDDKEYDVDKRLSKSYTKDNLKANTIYKFSERGSATFTFEKTRTDMDYGFNSVSSYSEDDNKLGFRASQMLGEDLSISANGRMSLSQKFYKKYEENPRDVDYYYYGGGAEMSAQPFENVDAKVEVKASRYETRNIDASLSSDNNVEYIYRLIPEFSIKPAGWITISQSYEVKMEYTEFTFDRNQNYLDRTTILDTKAKMRFQRGLNFGINHKYDMRDSGSYLTVEDEKHYNRTRENFKHRLKMNVDYKAADFLNLFSSALFRTEKRNSLGVENEERIVTNSNFYDSGTLKVGFEGEKDVVGNGNIKLDVAYVRNYGNRISEAMRKYWDINMKLTFDF